MTKGKNKLLYITTLLPLCFILLSLGSCVNKSEHKKALTMIDSLQRENKKLIMQNEELLNGETRLMNYITLYNDSGNYLKAYEYLIKLKKNHPESQFLLQNKKLFTEIEIKGLSITDSLNKVKEDSLKLANINKLGIWKIGEFVNDFDEPTGQKYVYADFYGHFQNSATADGNLRIRAKVYGEKNNFTIYLSYDEYDNGTYEDDRCKSTSIINKQKRKKYVSLGPTLVFLDTETSSEYNLQLKDILINEGIYDFHMRFEYNTIYEFSINTQYLNNALIKAGLKDIE